MTEHHDDWGERVVYSGDERMPPIKTRLRAMQGESQDPANLYKVAADRIQQLEGALEWLRERLYTLEGQRS